jgi:hypothetical protein
MTDSTQRKQQIIMQGALCRAQLLSAGNEVRHAADIKVIAEQAKDAALSFMKSKLHVQQRKVEKLVPRVLDGVLTASSASARVVRKPVLYGAMILGAISVLPRFFKGRKSNDSE